VGAMTKHRDQGGAAFSPLVEAMAAQASRVIGRVVVRSPIIDWDAELDARTTSEPTHELIGRFGIRLRAPFVILRRQRRQKLSQIVFHAEPGALLSLTPAAPTKLA
jgi:hypothetical protein